MSGSDLMLVLAAVNIVAVIVLLARYYQARIDEAREEANFWRRKAEHLDKPVA